MKNSSIRKVIVYSAIALLPLASVNAQNSPQLAKYADENLYSAKAEFQVAGNWKGNEFQYNSAKTLIEERFEYELQFTQEGNRITGTSLITDAQGNFSKMQLRGFVLGSKLHFEEYAIVEQVMKRPNTIWCLTTGELLIVQKDNRIFLSGTLDGFASDPFSCNQTYVALESNNKEVVNKQPAQEPSSLSPDKTQQELLANFFDSRQQMDAYPNPFVEEVTIRFSPEIKGDITLEIIDITGKKIATLIDAKTPANSNEIKFRPPQQVQNTGLYFAVLRTNDKIYTRQLLQIK